jgi:hypothetical protein
MDYKKGVILILCLLPLMGQAQIPGFLNPDLLAKPDHIMIFQAYNQGIDDPGLYNRINMTIARTINKTQRFITTDNSQQSIDPHALEEYLLLLDQNEEQSVDAMREVDYILLFTLGAYETNLNIDKTMEIEVLTNSLGVIEEIDHYKLVIESQLSFDIQVHIISRQSGVEVESLTEKINASKTYSYEVDKDEYKGNLLWAILEAIVRENRLSASKERLDRLFAEVQVEALDDLAYQLKKGLNESHTFKVATRIIYEGLEDLYFNQGELWEVGRGDFYSVKQARFNNTLLQVNEVREMYSRSTMIWGQAHSNDVVVLREITGIGMHIGTRLIPVSVNPQFQEQVISNLLGSSVLAPPLQQQWLHSFSWRTGYDQLLDFYVLGVGDVHFGSELNMMSMGISAGYKWQAGRLTLAAGAGLRYTYISSSFSLSQALATNIGWTVDPAGNANINVRTYLDLITFQPELEFRFSISPHFAMRVQGAWHLNMGQDVLKISASQKVPDPEATDGSTISEEVYKGTLPNQYFIPGNWELNYGLLFIF